ncbi:MAG: hypothetical protein AB1531_00170 [Chloroflexota bacterium]
MKERTRQALEDCVEKASKLRNMKLDEHIKHTIKGFRGHKMENEEWEIKFDLPDEEKGDASLFTFRLFLQHNENYSFAQIKHLLTDTSLSQEFRSKMENARHAFFEITNQHPLDIQKNFFEVGEHPTWGEILNVVIYGAMAHTNDKTKRQKYQCWTKDEIRKYVLLQHFWFIVAEVLNHIYRISDLCREELDRQNQEIQNSKAS